MNDIEISIRSIQHYMYCPHRWGLLEIDRAWAENAFVTKANLLHERVHDPANQYTARGKKVYTSVPVYNDLEQYNLYGIVDCLEMTEDASSICIVEYKPTKPKIDDYNAEDLMQVFAQKICVDYVFHCNSTAVLYYADVKRRIRLPLEENYTKYNERLLKMLKDMRTAIEKGVIPLILKNQKCSGCSMRDMCMPSSQSSKNSKAIIDNIIKEEI